MNSFGIHNGCEGVPTPVLTKALYERFSSRGDADFQDKLLSMASAGIWKNPQSNYNPMSGKSLTRFASDLCCLTNPQLILQVRQ
jgi:hypothetical protein